LALEEYGEDVLLEIDVGSAWEVSESNFCDDEGLVELGAEKGREGKEVDWCEECCYDGHLGIC